jgi:mono/diheme cytochrome c family protein
VAAAVGFAVVVLFAARPATAQEPDPAQLEAGAEVYQAVCAACHQADGAGIPERFPPLKDNERTTDPSYVEGVVRDGIQGPLEVNGVSYDSIMPPPAGLSEDDILAVAAYVAANLEVPGAAQPDLPPAAGSVATQLPTAVRVASLVGFLLSLGVLAVVLAPMALATTDRLHLPWPNAWLKSGVIVLYFIIATAVMPSLVLKSGVVAGFPRTAQDFVGTAVWGGALVAGLWGLRWAQRSNRI